MTKWQPIQIMTYYFCATLYIREGATNQKRYSFPILPHHSSVLEVTRLINQNMILNKFMRLISGKKSDRISIKKE